MTYTDLATKLRSGMTIIWIFMPTECFHDIPLSCHSLTQWPSLCMSYRWFYGMTILQIVIPSHLQHDNVLDCHTFPWFVIPKSSSMTFLCIVIRFILSNQVTCHTSLSYRNLYGMTMLLIVIPIQLQHDISSDCHTDPCNCHSTLQHCHTKVCHTSSLVCL